MANSVVIHESGLWLSLDMGQGCTGRLPLAAGFVGANAGHGPVALGASTTAKLSARRVQHCKVVATASTPLRAAPSRVAG